MSAPRIDVESHRSALPQEDARTFRELSSDQWKSGIAAWLGWLFDGLDMHIYTLVATAFVAILLNNATFRSDFSTLDRDRNGEISASEWKRPIPLESIDRNGNGSVSLEEFQVFEAR